MRCPYCGGLNQERAVFCVNCGRDLRRAQQNVQPQRQPTQPQQPGYPTNQPNRGANQQAQSQTQATSRRQSAVASRAPAPIVAPTPVPEPEPPGPFPPRTLAQFVALLATGSQAYTVTSSEVENGKKIVSIAYPRCANWQQAATLLKALQEQHEDRYTTIIVRGMVAQRQDAYGFTNGQIQFDRSVRLGARICNRYTLETGNGYSADSIRFVLNE